MIGRHKETIINEISQYDLNYLAGFIDGEGTLTIIRYHRKDRGVRSLNYRPLLSITNTNYEILVWIKNVIGIGNISTFQVNGDNQKLTWRYCVYGSNAIALAEKLYPFLRIKKLQAEILFRFGETLIKNHGRNGTPDDVYLLRDQFTKDVQKLNLRGILKGD